MPAAVWLFGSGLLALGNWRRSRGQPTLPVGERPNQTDRLFGPAEAYRLRTSDPHRHRGATLPRTHHLPLARSTRHRTRTRVCRHSPQPVHPAPVARVRCIAAIDGAAAHYVPLISNDEGSRAVSGHRQRRCSRGLGGLSVEHLMGRNVTPVSPVGVQSAVGATFAGRDHRVRRRTPRMVYGFPPLHSPMLGR